MSHDKVVPPSSQDHTGSPLYTALARTTTRVITLYFSRPVRLFRPSKVSGWHSLRGHANRHGTTLSPQYIISLIKSQGVLTVIPKHFIPPMLANAVLGTILWSTYTECSGYLESSLGAHSIFTVALSGAAAGGMQALVAAPVDNVRAAIEGGTGKGWSHAWKEVFRGTHLHITTRPNRIRDIRQVRLWMKDVSEMAGRGWTGWGWGYGKDVFGFAAFFTVFETTRKLANKAKLATHDLLERPPSRNQASHLPRFAHAFTLVCGGMMAGLVYESLCRPWDVARRVITLEKSIAPQLGSRRSSFSVLMKKLQEDGITSFFREHSVGFAGRSELKSNVHRRISSALRVLARIGPWGVAFLVWESFGPGLD
ncbi:hypothetical protein JVT61DRAFT_9614 [Boletus reticuloceps]|uniref:Mitochondrial carrier protein n=1 Tax=Boletus reticuloceps TaxID=495285 RepID=A0A8I2YGQ2_9AGAM|nr:hypothetical protein JVT61DRAFT_9614 [Boletus reticuloceps]